MEKEELILETKNTMKEALLVTIFMDSANIISEIQFMKEISLNHSRMDLEFSERIQK